MKAELLEYLRPLGTVVEFGKSVDLEAWIDRGKGADDEGQGRYSLLELREQVKKHPRNKKMREENTSRTDSCEQNHPKPKEPKHFRGGGESGKRRVLQSPNSERLAGTKYTALSQRRGGEHIKRLPSLKTLT